MPNADIPSNRATGKFYDRVRWLYPAIEPWMAGGRRQCIRRINRESPGNLLEIGAGSGRHLRQFYGHRVNVIDVSESMVRSCRRHCPDVRVLTMDGECTMFEDESFDLVALFHVLSVTANPGRMLEEVHRLLRPGGKVYILNHESGTGRSGWVARALEPVGRVLRLHAQFRLDRWPEFRSFRVLDRWSYGPFGIFNGTLLMK